MIAVGDIVTIVGGDVRILAMAEGYVMVRRKDAIPFIMRADDLDRHVNHGSPALPPATQGISTYDAAQLLGIHEGSLILYARQGRVGFRAQKGRRVVYRFYRDDLEKFRRECLL